MINSQFSYSSMQNPRHAADLEALVRLHRERHIALQTTKCTARQRWQGRPKTYNIYFYELLDTQEAIGKAVHWVLGYPGAFLITAGDMQVLPKILDAADRFEARPSDAEMATLAAEFAIQPVFA